MAKYGFTNKAVQDLEDIWYYTVETWSEDFFNEFIFKKRKKTYFCQKTELFEK